jgi:SanA protein
MGVKKGSATTSKRRWKKTISTGSICLLTIATFLALANARILTYIYLDAARIPHHRVGIVLGCAPTTDSHPNPFFVGRINSAAMLFHAGKVDRLLVSGDNGTKGYDEPLAMTEALIAKGMPVDRIMKDCAGFRTLDSMIRAKKVFGLNEATIITDDFHMARSLYFADGAGMRCDGFASRAVPNPTSGSIEFREILARGRAVLDQDILHASPKFLGKPQTIP